LRDLMVSRHLSTSAMVSGRSLTSGTLIFDYGQHAMWVIP
jgi:hypothetical protein